MAGVLFMCSVIFAIFFFVNDGICLHNAFKSSSYFWYEQVNEILLEKKKPSPSTQIYVYCETVYDEWNLQYVFYSLIYEQVISLITTLHK